MSYIDLTVHAVFRTYRSEPVLPTDSHIDSLYYEVMRITKDLNCTLVRINAMPEHVHMLISYPATITVAEMMRKIKSISSQTIKAKPGFEQFTAWGAGYAALSKSSQDKPVVIKYIKNQQEHHKTLSFKDEYKSYIEEMGQVIDERDWGR